MFAWWTGQKVHISRQADDVFPKARLVVWQLPELRAAALTPEQIALMEQFNVVVGAEFFRGQDISYLFGYLLFALLFGWLFGMLGGALAKRQISNAKESNAHLSF